MKKIRSIIEFSKDKVYQEVVEILNALEDDYDLDVLVDYKDIYLIIEEFYSYYVSLGIAYEFRESMINHFNDIAIMAVENNCIVDNNFILEGLRLFELCEAAIEIVPEDVSKVLEKIKRISTRRKDSEE